MASLNAEGSDFLKLKALAATTKDKNAVEIIRKRKLHLPKKFQDLFDGILKDDDPKVVAEKAVKTMESGMWMH